MRPISCDFCVFVKKGLSLNFLFWGSFFLLSMYGCKMHSTCSVHICSSNITMSPWSTIVVPRNNKLRQKLTYYSPSKLTNHPKETDKITTSPAMHPVQHRWVWPVLPQVLQLIDRNRPPLVSESWIPDHVLLPLVIKPPLIHAPVGFAS